jgi:hypothetical protein
VTICASRNSPNFRIKIIAFAATNVSLGPSNVTAEALSIVLPLD